MRLRLFFALNVLLALVGCSGESVPASVAVQAQLQASPAVLPQEGGEVWLQWGAQAQVALHSGQGWPLRALDEDEQAAAPGAPALAAESADARLWPFRGQAASQVPAASGSLAHDWWLALPGDARPVASVQVLQRPAWRSAKALTVSPSVRVAALQTLPQGDVLLVAEVVTPEAGTWQGGQDLAVWRWDADGQLRLREQAGSPGHDAWRGAARLPDGWMGLLRQQAVQAEPPLWFFWSMAQPLAVQQAVACPQGLDDVLAWQADAQRPGHWLLLGHRTGPQGLALVLRDCRGTVAALRELVWPVSQLPEQVLLPQGAMASRVPVLLTGRADFGAGASGGIRPTFWQVDVLSGLRTAARRLQGLGDVQALGGVVLGDADADAPGAGTVLWWGQDAVDTPQAGGWWWRQRLEGTAGGNRPGAGGSLRPVSWALDHLPVGVWTGAMVQRQQGPVAHWHVAVAGAVDARALAPWQAVGGQLLALAEWQHQPATGRLPFLVYAQDWPWLTHGLGARAAVAAMAADDSGDWLVLTREPTALGAVLQLDRLRADGRGRGRADLQGGCCPGLLASH